MDLYAFCEPATASSYSKWHIRHLTNEGRKLGGGADTLALCGREVSWDMAVPITEFILLHACPMCAEKYRKEINEQP